MECKIRYICFSLRFDKKPARSIHIVNAGSGSDEVHFLLKYLLILLKYHLTLLDFIAKTTGSILVQIIFLFFCFICL